MKPTHLKTLDVNIDAGELLNLAQKGSLNGDSRVAANRFLAAFLNSDPAWSAKSYCWARYTDKLCTLADEGVRRGLTLVTADDMLVLEHIASDTERSSLFEIVNAFYARGYCQNRTHDRAGAEQDLRQVVDLVSSASEQVRASTVTMPNAAAASFQATCCGPLLDELDNCARRALDQISRMNDGADLEEEEPSADDASELAQAESSCMRSEPDPNANLPGMNGPSQRVEEEFGATTQKNRCTMCGKTDVKLLKCAGCKASVRAPTYCSARCQKAHWKRRHKLEYLKLG